MLIRRVKKSDVGMLQSIQRIYVDSIPASERKPESWLMEVAERTDYSLFAAIVDEVVVGFGIVFLPSDESFSLLEYFAVDAAHRSRGVGSELILQILAKVEPRCVFVEVESDLGIEPQNARRQVFYRRLGFRRVVGLNYLLPLNTSPPPMDLLVLRPPDPLGRQLLKNWLAIVYRQVYGQSGGDSRLANMISHLPDPLRLE
jgi:GNAT superfamily N-acetyltransferase